MNKNDVAPQRIAISLTFDVATDQTVRGLWLRLADAGIPAPGLTSYRPHITLAAYDATDVATYETNIAPLAAAGSPFPLHLDALGIFPETGVLFLAPRMSHALFSLHREVLGAFDGPGRPPVVAEHLLPDHWAPHCTLAGGLTPPQLLAALDACIRSWAPIRGQAAGIGLRIQPTPLDHRHYPFPTGITPGPPRSG